ncbi:hypothetical protein [Vreelandella neptunia]|uniref:Uncharacterized protein n=1 Tax=Vreelandella neptunia TaxID=115551 RepID=A0ABZ0YJL2_9GAMM|nr:hypothetical protein [Halomonas neptunia]MDN3562714.1 hypothetical protein [Halomonas neptunia]WQH11749.1 hypothetical protein SR894_16525 [Halomonas neptunia]
MSSFYNYYTFQKAPENRNLLAKNSSFPVVIAESVVSAAEKTDLPKDVKSAQLYDLAKNIAEDDGFVKELSDAIGEPKREETEDMFVERSSKKMKEMLMAKLKKS